MKKGFTLIEFVVVMAIAAIILSTASLSVSKVKERRALEESKNKVTEILSMYRDKSFNEGEVYEVTLDYVNKKIEVRDDSTTLVEKEELPSMLEYTTVEKVGGVPVKKSSKIAETTIDGGMTSFSVYIFDTDENARYRIAVDGINASKLAHVNVYENKSADVTLDNVASYSFVDSQWEKE